MVASTKQSSYDLFGALFKQMDNPKPATAGRFKGVRYFNGGLFSTVDTIELTNYELELIGDDDSGAALKNWSKVNPAIFGTLFQDSMESIPVDRFRNIGHTTGGISDDQLATLLPPIASRPGGFTIALDCAWIRMALAGKNNQPLPSTALVSAARSVLVEHKFDRANGFEHYHYSEVVAYCLTGAGQEDAVGRILKNLQAAVYPGLGIGFHDASPVMSALITAQPLVTLDTVFENCSQPGKAGLDGLLDRHDTSALNLIPCDQLSEWCDREPAVRYLWAAANLHSFGDGRTTEERHWHPTARALLLRAPDRIAVMKRYIDQLHPTSWNGSRAVAWETNLKLLDNFDADGDEQLQNFVQEQRSRFKTVIEKERANEEAEERRNNETFE